MTRASARPGRLPRGAVPRSADGMPSVGDLAALDELAEQLNRLGFPSLALPGTVPPCVDVGLPGDMAPGERVYLHDGMFVWRTGRPVGRSDRPAAAAAVIARALRTAAPARRP